jgi:Cof subfamily protein (haloacid dehalogenase superfamily)
VPQLIEARRYSVLVCDIDGTLVGENKEVAPGVVGAIHAAQHRGVRVCLATGRMWESAGQFVDAIGVDPPIMLYNGGLVYDFKTDRTLWVRLLPRQQVLKILPVLRKFPQVSPLLFLNGKVYAERRTPLADLYARRNRVPIELAPEVDGAPTFEALLAADPMKMLNVGAPADLAGVSAALAAIPNLPLNLVYSQADYLEILPGGVSKGAAMPVLARALGVPLDRVVAVGDADNDITMLKAAGLGVAVEGSPPEVLAAAGWVCLRPEHEGVRVLIERLFL